MKTLTTEEKALKYCSKEYFDERAGFLEFQCNMDRKAAEIKVLIEVSIHKKHEQYKQNRIEGL